MKQLMVVETRDPFEASEVESIADLLTGLQHEGIECSILLAENGVLGARASAPVDFLPKLAKQGVTLMADRFALAERGIPEDELTDGVKPSELGVILDHLTAGAAVMWR